ncbi:MAG TPA: MFS transporter [Micromonosporaceae bacterium]|nr:MFS transporter [Micromonosporaceae bacterium]
MAPRGTRPVALILAVLVAAAATVMWPLLGDTATAAASTAATNPVHAVRAPGDLCSTEEWQADFRGCVERLQEVGHARASCLEAPMPDTPDSGLAGWFVDRPESAGQPGPRGLYSDYGYAGYSYTTYDIGCASGLISPEYKFTTTVANGEFMFATAIIGASNALRERAWDPRSLWSWADPLVDQATKAIYQKVFSVFGIVTLCVVGLYLLWRSRQSDMSNAMTTAGWALLVMVAVTALAAWPVKSANLADSTLISTLGIVHDAVGPRPQDRPAEDCRLGDPKACKDHRPPAVRASDTVAETMLYRNWLRGVLGSADSETAKRYGRALYDARSLSWEEAQKLRENPATRDATIAAKKRQWMKVAEQIKAEDPEAYEYLRGTRDMDRIGAGFIALLAAILFAMFDLTASLLVLLGFLIFRWAVVAAPVLGTVGLLRPASTGLRRLGNAVVAAVFNIAIFGTGAAIYLFAVDLVMSTPTLPGWLQVVLVWLCGVVGWLLLRPYRRITQLGGKDATAAVTAAGSWHRRFFRDLREAAKLNVVEPGADSPTGNRQVVAEQTNLRPEARREELPQVGGPGNDEPRPAAAPRPEAPRQRRAAEWTEPDVSEPTPSYAIYRPGAETSTPVPSPRVRAEAR